MPELKDIADQYIEHYRKMIDQANRIIGIALLILLINWLFSIEPGYYQYRDLQRHYKKQQLKATHEIRDLILRERLYQNEVDRTQKSLKPAPAGRVSQPAAVAPVSDDLQQGLNNLEKQISATRDTIKILKKKRADLQKAKHTSLTEFGKDVKWESLIKFVFVIAANPQEGSIYLVGLVLFVIGLGYLYRYFCFHYLAKAVRLIEASPEKRNAIDEYVIPSPFWLAPLPVDVKAGPYRGTDPPAGTEEVQRTDENSLQVGSYREVTGEQPAITVPGAEALIPLKIGRPKLAAVLDWSFRATEKNWFIALSLLFLLALEIRLSFIAIASNGSIQFDATFSLCAMLFLLSLCLTGMWLWPLKVDDHLHPENSPNSNRRLIVAAAVLLVTGTVLRSRINWIGGLFRKNAKRFIGQNQRTVVPGTVKPGLYLRKYKLKTRTFDAKQDKFITRRTSVIRVYYVAKPQSALSFDCHTRLDFERFKKRLVPVDVSRLPDPAYEHHQLYDQAKYVFGKRHGPDYIEGLTRALAAVNKNYAVMFLREKICSTEINPGNGEAPLKLFDFSARFLLHLGELTVLREVINYWMAKLYPPSPEVDEYALLNVSRLGMRLGKWQNEKWINRQKGKKP